MADKKVVLCFLWCQNLVLLYLRDDKAGIAHPNYWALLGGGMNGGESPQEALEREIEEETGRKAVNLSYCGEIEVVNQPLCHDHTIYLFEGEMFFSLDEMHLTEGQRLGLFTIEEFMNLKFPGFLREFIITHILG